VLALSNITFAAEDPERLGGFWAEVLDGYEAEGSGEDVHVRGDGPGLLFRRMAKSPTIEVPIHLDVNVPDRKAELERLLGLGARLVATKSDSIGEFTETERDIGNVTFSCAEPVPLGRFWAAALGWPDEDIDEAFLQRLRDDGIDERELTGFYATRNPDGSRPRFLFQRRERSRPESYPIHLDFRSDGSTAEIERLRALGATIADAESEAGRASTVMRDPEGNPFCVE
jgi:predicted enzyme related to lactoylglutathione lyase